MSGEITKEEWLAELNHFGLVESGWMDALSARELVELTGQSMGWVLRKLRWAVENGLVESVRKRGIDITGRVISRPAYRLVKTARGKK